VADIWIALAEQVFIACLGSQAYPEYGRPEKTARITTGTLVVATVVAMLVDVELVLELDVELLGAVVVEEAAVVVEDGAVVPAVLVELATVDGGAVLVPGGVVVVVASGTVVVVGVVVVIDEEATVVERVVGTLDVFDGCVVPPLHAPNTARTAIQVIRRIGTILPLLLIGTGSPVLRNRVTLTQARPNKVSDCL